MAKYFQLDEAAQLLGVTPDELVEMRSAGEIHGYRDGASWKFKSDEVERLAADRGLGGGSDEDVDDSVLVSEESLGHSGETTSSTIIGKDEAEGSDLALSSDLALDSSGELEIPADSGIDSDVTLVPGDGSDSDVSLVPDPGSDKEIVADDSAVLGSGTGDLDLTDASSDALGSSDLDALDDALALSDDDDLVLSGSGSGSGTGTGSDLSLSAADSGIDLSSPSDSGLSLEADSGISLQSPTDSGLSLEDEAIDMGGSSISSLELPEDDEVSLADVAADSGVQKDEQFMLEPSDDMFADESDSGSQVIALEDSEAFEQEGMDGDLGGDNFDELGALGAAPSAPVLAPSHGRPGELAEAPYSVWNIMGLVTIALFLLLTGILMTDTVRNMWAWEEGRDVSTGLSEGITKAFGLNR